MLFEPIQVGGVALPNRIAVTAMVTRLAGDDGYVNEAVIDRYRRFAEGGAGLVVVEATSVHGGKSGPLLRASSDDFIPGLARIADACHRGGAGKIFLQIIHFLKIARTGWRQKVDSLSAEELLALPEMFASAAQRAERAGFDGVELHMAHAYTLSSFLSRRNARADEFGRGLESRMRLPSMVLDRVIASVGENFAVGVRFDGEESIRRGYSLPDAQEFALRFAELGAAYVSLSAGGKFEDAIPHEGRPLYPYTGFSGDRCMPGDTYPDAANIWLAEGVRRHLRNHGLDTPVVGTGKISTPTLAEELLRRGACDITGMARSLLADPYWPRKHLQGRQNEIVRCIYCNVCKALDENFKTVVCFLWPKGSVQAPRPEDHAQADLQWSTDRPLTSSMQSGEVKLRWPAVEGRGPTAGYDVFRAESQGGFERLTACSKPNHSDDIAVAGRAYRYFVVPYDPAGRRGQVSNVVDVETPGFAPAETMHE